MQHQIPAPNMMTDVEVARYLGLSVGTIRRWRLLGASSLPYRRFGGSVRYWKEEVDEWIRKQPAGCREAAAVI